MRALIFTGGKGPDIEEVRYLLGSYSSVVAADSGIYAAEAAGIVPDIIVGDMDSLHDRTILKKYPQDSIQQWPKDKDFTDTELALHLLREKGFDDIILIGGNGGRIDHFLAIRSLFDNAIPPSVWIGDESAVFSVGKGCVRQNICIRNLQPEDTISFFPTGTNPHLCKSSGVYWPIDELAWDAGKFSLSNRCKSGVCSFEALAGGFIVITPITVHID